MFSTEECIEILNHDVLELSDGVILNCNMNTLEIPSRELSITLNESQKRLLVCLMKKVCTKRDIINVVWYENHQRIRDNNYHQLTFQLRALFQRNELPANLLVTVPYYGLKLNESQWKTLSQQSVAPDAAPAVALPVSKVKVDTKQADALAAASGSSASPPRMSSHRLFIQNAILLCLFVVILLFI